MPHYDPKGVNIILAGAQITGYADGSFVKVEYNTELWKLQVGCDGESIRSKSNDLSAKITITLMPSSFANTLLMAAYMADLGANAGAVPLVIFDTSTNTSHVTEGAWVVKAPSRDYDKEAKPVEWMLECAKLITVYGFSTESP